MRSVDSLLGINITEHFVWEKTKEILAILLNSYRKHGGCYSILCEYLNRLLHLCEIFYGGWLDSPSLSVEIQAVENNQAVPDMVQFLFISFEQCNEDNIITGNLNFAPLIGCFAVMYTVLLSKNQNSPPPPKKKSAFSANC